MNKKLFQIPNFKLFSGGQWHEKVAKEIAKNGDFYPKMVRTSSQMTLNYPETSLFGMLYSIHHNFCSQNISESSVKASFKDKNPRNPPFGTLPMSLFAMKY